MLHYLINHMQFVRDYEDNDDFCGSVLKNIGSQEGKKIAAADSDLA